MEYIVTFFAHIGAIRFNKACKENNIESVIMPVPRNLSSSCGTCVKFTNATPEVPVYLTWVSGEDAIMCEYENEVEQVVKITGDGYECLYKDEN